MDWWLLNFFIGTILSLFLPIVPAFFYVILFLFLSFVFFAKKPARSSSGFYLGIAWMLFNGWQYNDTWSINNISSAESSHQYNRVVGHIINIPAFKLDTYRINFKVTQLNEDVLTKPMILRLSWKLTDKSKQIIPSELGCNSLIQMSCL